MFRLFYILNKLDTGTVKTSELAREFNVTQRTVQRDLELLSAAGFPLTYEEGKYTFIDGFSLNRLAPIVRQEMNYSHSKLSTRP